MRRYLFAHTMLILGLLLLLIPSCQEGHDAETDQVLEIDSRVQLFVDDHLIDTSDRVWLTLGGDYNNHTLKVDENPLIKADRPWEGYLALQPGSVLYDEEEQIFKMWYNALSSHV